MLENKEIFLEKEQPISARQWNKTVGNQVTIQRMSELETIPDQQAEETQVANQHRPGLLRKIFNFMSGFYKIIKMAMKSSIWGALVGLSYWLIGYLGTSKDHFLKNLTKGQFVGIIALIVNALSMLFTIFGALGWLNTDTRPAEAEEETPKDCSGGILGVGTAIAAITTDGFAIGMGSDKDIGIAGLLTEIGSAMKSFNNMSSNWSVDRIRDPEMWKKECKYMADLLASLVGAVAYAISISDSSGALPIFLAEFIIRAVRCLFSVVNTLYMLCCGNARQADEVDEHQDAAELDTAEMEV